MTICPFITDSFSILFSVLPDLQAYWQHTTFHLSCCALQLKDGSYRNPSAEPYPELVRWPTKPSLPTDGKYHQMLVFSSWVWRLPIVKHCSCLSFKCSILDCPRATSESHLMFGWGFTIQRAHYQFLTSRQRTVPGEFSFSMSGQKTVPSILREKVLHSSPHICIKGSDCLVSLAVYCRI